MDQSSNPNLFSAFVLGLLVSLGLIGCGYFIAKAVYKAKMTDHYITVKGLSERVVKSDLAA